MLSSRQSPMIHAELKTPLDFQQSERLLAFCLESGVSCFSATLLYWDEQQLRRANAAFFDRLAPFILGRRRLERTVVPDGGDRLIPMKCWALNPQTVRLILDACGGSLSAYEMGRLPEDWTFYRSDQLFLGFVSHEDYAFLHLSDEDFGRFKSL